ncbi:MAG TPA: hypothetical protein VF593_00725 [Chthoniobacteraceae bacterium]|jgi:hypothetical protein
MNSDPLSGRRERLWLIAFFSFTLALTVMGAVLLWGFAGAQQQAVTKAFGAMPLPPISEFFYEYRWGFLLIPIPWIAFAIFACIRGTVSNRALVAFSSSLSCSMMTLFIVSLIAFSLAWFPRYLLSGNAGLHLDREELAQTLLAAEREDAEANFRLFLHYTFTTSQVELADRYLDRASSLGHPKAQTYVKLRSESEVRK